MRVGASDMQFLRAASWNVNGDVLSASAPASWAFGDKMLALRRDLARWSCDIVSLQECASSLRCDLLGAGYEFIGAARYYIIRHSAAQGSEGSMRDIVITKSPW